MGAPPISQLVTVDGSDASLEGLLETPSAGELSGIAVVCHPHPLHGGTMTNKVAHTVARAFVAEQACVLRFNFRGVGNSAGEFDHGNGELRDALAALAYVSARHPGQPVWLAGFSFGGAVAIRAALQCDVAGLVSVAPAVSGYADSLTAEPTCPWLIVQGDQDELVDIDETIKFVNHLQARPSLAVIQGGEHFFHGRLVELRNLVQDFYRENSTSA